MEIFNFVFSNPLGFLIAFIPGLFNLGMVCYILIFLPRNKLTNLFALLTLSLAVWQFDDALARISRSAASADIWDCILSPAWIFVGALCLHFSLLYSQLLKEDIFRVFIALIYAPGFIFMGIYQSHIYQHNFQYSGIWGWVNYYNDSLPDKLMIWWITLMVLAACLVFIYKTYKTRKDSLLFSQSLIITVGMAIPTVAGILTQMIFPVLLDRPSIPVTSTFMSFFSIATVIALKRFKLFRVADLISGDALIQSLPIMIFSVSGIGRINYLNRFAMDAFGIDPEDIDDLNTDIILRNTSPAHRAVFSQAWEQALNGASFNNIEMSILKSGRMMDILATVNPIINNYQVQGVLFTARDITELKRSHLQIRTSEALLKEAQEISHIGSWEWDINGNVVTWSDELYRIYGYRPGEVQVSYETFLSKLHPHDKEVADKIIREALVDHQPFEFYHRIMPNDNKGDIKLILARGSVTVDENGYAIRMNGTGQDVTQMKKNEDMLRIQNLELKKIYSELDQFVYRVSHDLRSPLTSMQGLIDIALSETSDPIIIQYLHLLSSSVEEQDKFIRDILDHSKNSRTDVKLEEIEFSALLNPIIERQKKLHDKDADVKINLRQNAPLLSDKTRLAIIFKNIISNAFVFSEPDRPLSVEISLDISEKEVVIIVRDNGTGISPDQQGKVFEMFYRGSKLSQGSGLGLYIVYDIVHKLHGHITVDSEPDAGTSFTIRIPNSHWK